MRAVKSVYNELEDEGKAFVDHAFTDIYENFQHILSVELNLSYYIQALSVQRSQRKEEILVELFDKQTSHLIKRQIIITMANWECFYWISDIKQNYSGLSDWEKRAFILASYFLRDEGKHWRDHTKRTWTPMDLLVRDWFSDKFQNVRTIPL